MLPLSAKAQAFNNSWKEIIGSLQSTHYIVCSINNVFKNVFKRKCNE